MAAWNQTDPAPVSGIDAFDELIAGVQTRFAGMRFTRGEVLEAHHNVARITWELVPAAGGEAVVGFDVAAVDADERITSVYGFIDKTPG